MSKKLYINLLGAFSISYGDKMLRDVNRSRLKKLLSWLIINAGTIQSRRRISFLFWPDSTEKQARTNLRNLIYHLKEALPEADQYVQIERDTLHWNPRAPVSIDVQNFEEAYKAAVKSKENENRREQIIALKRAIQIYKDPLLPDCYDKWIEKPRDRLRNEYRDILIELIQLLEEQRDFTQAIKYALKWTQFEPINESAWQKLMKLYANNNNRTGALKAYQKCVRILRKEFDVDPDPKTKMIFERLINNYRGTVYTESNDRSDKEETWPFIGRQTEWKTINASWKQALSGETQCLIIKGAAGTGKTRLGMEFLNMVSRQGYVALYSRCYEMASTMNFAPIIGWLNEEAVYNQLVNLEKVWLNKLAHLSPQLLVDYPDTSLHGQKNEPWQGQQMFEAIAQGLTAGSKAKLLFIDELHWCDKETLKWISYFLHKFTSKQLLIMGAVRDGALSSNQRLQILLDEIQFQDRVKVLSLEPLKEMEATELACHLTSEPIEGKAAKRLYKVTNGNPLFIVEAVKDAQWVDDSLRGTYSAIDDKTDKQLPEKIRKLILSRFHRLSKRDRKVIELIAVIGKACSFEVLNNIYDEKESQLMDSLDHLIKQNLIIEHDTNSFDFTRDILRAVVLGEITETRKEWISQRVNDLKNQTDGDYRTNHQAKNTSKKDERNIVEAYDILNKEGSIRTSVNSNNVEASSEFLQLLSGPKQHRHSGNQNKLKSVGGKRSWRATLSEFIYKPSSNIKDNAIRIGSVLIPVLMILIASLYFYSGTSPRVEAVAVLPLKNLSDIPEQEYFVEGMHSALVSELGRQLDVKVINHISSMYYKNNSKPLPQIGQELAVQAVVIASIYRSENRVRFSAELVDVESEENIWSKTFERDIQDIVSLQGRVAKEIAQEIGEKLVSIEQSSSYKSVTRSQTYRPRQEVYDSFLKGRYYSVQTGKGLDKAVQYFQEAIEKDPNFAKAHASLAEAAMLIPDTQFVKRGIRAAYKAVELNPNLSEAQAAFGIAKMIEWDWEDSEKAFQKAIELNPNSSMAYQWYAQLLRQTMNYDKAYQMARRAEELNPLSLMAKSMVGWVLFNMHKYDDAIKVWDEVIELDREFGLAYYNKGLVYWMQGKGVKVIEMAKKASSVDSPVHDLHYKWLSAVGYHLTGQQKSFATIVRQVEDIHGESRPTVIASLYHVKGENREALKWLEKAYDQHYPWLPNILTEPIFDGMRDYPEFTNLMNRLDYPN